MMPLNCIEFSDDTMTKQRKNQRNQRYDGPTPRPTLSNTTHSTPTSWSWVAPTRPANKLSWEEMQERRKNALCFNCNEKFTLGHRCQGPLAFFIEKTMMSIVRIWAMSCTNSTIRDRYSLSTLLRGAPGQRQCGWEQWWANMSWWLSLIVGQPTIFWIKRLPKLCA